ncbi:MULTISPECIES: hypothetical protein [unclassified Sinorhizobium]|uniref:hypothetical protein n=1 Tax=unclassified Sinorhizobium TaxID=2613772 RepID=UPI0024C3AABC|nr:MULTISPECIES: hypothetical protein [unclassified Sinorhizobium]MDK1374654.1 hypothetical protein [Sinorhizobium sp. 6-70]MDK1480728.1 hypothetical protein [Sinorhizobium sp. 6-117]
MTDIVGMDASVSSRIDLMRIVLVSGIVFARMRTGFGERLTRTGGLSFWIFCAHYPLLVLFWMLWNRSGLTYYPLFYFTMPILVIAILVASHNLMRRQAPDLLDALTGSRAGKGRMALPAQGGGHASYSPQQR